MIRRLYFIIIVLIMLLILNCGDTDRPRLPYSPFYENLVSEGWELYLDGNYSEALEVFREAINRDVTKADAFLGSGYCNLRLGDTTNAEAAFVLIFGFDVSDQVLADAYAGMSANYYYKKDYVNSIIYAKKVLEIKPDWAFSRDNSLDYNDIKATIAKSYLNMGDYYNAQRWLDAITDNFPSPELISNVSVGSVVPVILDTINYYEFKTTFEGRDTILTHCDVIIELKDTTIIKNVVRVNNVILLNDNRNLNVSTVISEDGYGNVILLSDTLVIEEPIVNIDDYAVSVSYEKFTGCFSDYIRDLIIKVSNY